MVFVVPLWAPWRSSGAGDLATPSDSPDEVPHDQGGDRYRGGFDASHNFHGKGEFHGADGTMYVGDYKHGQMHGVGEMRLTSGARYKGTSSGAPVQYMSPIRSSTPIL